MKTEGQGGDLAKFYKILEDTLVDNDKGQGLSRFLPSLVAPLQGSAPREPPGGCGGVGGCGGKRNFQILESFLVLCPPRKLVVPYGS